MIALKRKNIGEIIFNIESDGGEEKICELLLRETKITQKEAEIHVKILKQNIIEAVNKLYSEKFNENEIRIIEEYYKHNNLVLKDRKLKRKISEIFDNVIENLFETIFKNNTKIYN